MFDELDDDGITLIDAVPYLLLSDTSVADTVSLVAAVRRGAVYVPSELMEPNPAFHITAVLEALELNVATNFCELPAVIVAF